MALERISDQMALLGSCMRAGSGSSRAKAVADIADASLGSDLPDGIRAVATSYFEVGGYRYSDLSDATAEWRRRQQASILSNDNNGDGS